MVGERFFSPKNPSLKLSGMKKLHQRFEMERVKIHSTRTAEAAGLGSSPLPQGDLVRACTLGTPNKRKAQALTSYTPNPIDLQWIRGGTYWLSGISSAKLQMLWVLVRETKCAASRSQG